MKKPSNPAAPFYYELSAFGESARFAEVDGMPPRVISRIPVRDGENPFKYGVPSLPKNSNLKFKQGRSGKNSKLKQWCLKGGSEGGPPAKSHATLQLKDGKGNSWVEWKLYNAQPLTRNASVFHEHKNNTEIDELELAYSFYTLSKK